MTMRSNSKRERHEHRLHVFASISDWLVALLVCVVVTVRVS